MTAVFAFGLVGFGVWLLLRKGRPSDERRDARVGPVLDGVGDGPEWGGGDCGGDGGGG